MIVVCCYTGNDHLAALTSDAEYELRFDLWDFEGDHRYAKYGTFRVANATDKYRLTFGQYSGKAGECVKCLVIKNYSNYITVIIPRVCLINTYGLLIPLLHRHEQMFHILLI